MRQLLSLWRAEDGDAAAQEQAVTSAFIADPAVLDRTRDRLAEAFESADGHFLEIGRTWRAGAELERGPELPVDALLAATDLSAHLQEDSFSSKIAFTVLLNWPLDSLDQMVAQGPGWSRTRWAEARLTGRFATRPSGAALAQRAEASAAAEAYIAFQLEEKLEGPRSGAEFERVATYGRATPDLWMVHATGSPVSAEPRLLALASAPPGGEHWPRASRGHRRGVRRRIVVSFRLGMAQSDDVPARAASMVIEAVTPELDGGRSPVKRIAGEPLHVEADIFKEGHDALAAVVWWRQVSPPTEAGPWRAVPMHLLGNDRWAADVTLGPPGRVVFTLEAWPDTYRSWLSELERKVAVGRDVRSELLEGAALLRGCAARAEAAQATHDAQLLDQAAAALQGSPPVAIDRAAEARVVDAAARYPDRSIGRRDPLERPVLVERERARAGAWYELFPRSAAHGERHGTFRDAESLLPEAERLGFDVVYLPPIHPIGRSARKGRNNAPNAEPGDVGSPWAIGAREGGHTAVHPELGTLEDFRRFVGRASEHGLEVALDLAFQVSPDHPWVTEHPEWFQRRPDGTIKTAENPPKRYDDIVNFDFLGPGRSTLWPALLEVVLFWVQQGVRIFRVDNPHTKPLPFWEWLLREARERDPGLVFLSEAFTRPKLMRALAKLGFSQSYTHFTWRNHKRELTDYFQELRRPEWADAMRPNLWPNTPDILPEFLQRGGPPAFRIRVALAATLGASYGIYSGYEFCDAAVLQGEEYRDSEKYQLVDWRSRRSGDIREWIARLNEIRHAEPALQRDDGLRFFECDDPQVIFYGKRIDGGTSQVLVAVSLDPYRTHTAELQLPQQRYGLAGREVVEVEERLSGERQLWRGETATVTLTPERPAALWTVAAPARTEQAFDYFY